MAEKKEIVTCNVHPWILKRPNLPSNLFQAKWKVLNSLQKDLTLQEFYHVQGGKHGRMLFIMCRKVDNSKLLRNVSHDLIEILN
jgi:hypothetical protein